jgi:hypothetical protein
MSNQPIPDELHQMVEEDLSQLKHLRTLLKPNTMSLKSFRCQVLDDKKTKISDEVVITAPNKEAFDKLLNVTNEITTSQITLDCVICAFFPNAYTIEFLKEDVAKQTDIVLPWGYLSR